MGEPQRITSRDNALLVKLRRLSHDPTAYRKTGVVWVEGEHLCAAAQQRGWRAAHALVAESGWDDPALRPLARNAAKVSLLPDALFKTVSALESPPRIGFVLEGGADAGIEPGVATVVLDRVRTVGDLIDYVWASLGPA